MKSAEKEGGLLVHWGATDLKNAANGLRMERRGPKAVINHFWWGNDLRTQELDICDGSWHHVLATFDGRLRKVFVDLELGAEDEPQERHLVDASNTLTVG